MRRYCFRWNISPLRYPKPSSQFFGAGMIFNKPFNNCPFIGSINQKNTVFNSLRFFLFFFFSLTIFLSFFVILLLRCFVSHTTFMILSFSCVNLLFLRLIPNTCTKSGIYQLLFIRLMCCVLPFDRGWSVLNFTRSSVFFVILLFG